MAKCVSVPTVRVDIFIAGDNEVWLKKVLHDAVSRAIKEIGIAQFKKTSFFMSNEVEKYGNG